MTAFSRRRHVNWWRLLLGSFVGTTYVLILFIDVLSPLYSWYGKLGLSILMIITTFGLQRFDTLFKDTLIFYFVTFLFGGGIFALSFLFQGQESTLNGLLVFEDAYVMPKASFLTIAIGYVLMMLLSKFYFQAIEVGKRRSHYILRCRLQIMGEIIEVKGLLDSGNGLHEPITRVPVMIIQANCIATILPSQLLKTVQSGSDAIMDTAWFESLSVDWQGCLRIIPYRGVGKGSQMLIAIVPDWIEIQDGDKKFITKKARVGLTTEKLSTENMFEAILHPALLTNDQKEQDHNEEVQYAESTSS